MQWSPTHPAIFASCDAEGFVDIWNINKDREAPVARRQIFDDVRPLNSLRWSRDGRRLAIGDSTGQVSILAVDQEMSTAKSEDFDQVVSLVQQNS